MLRTLRFKGVLHALGGSVLACLAPAQDAMSSPTVPTARNHSLTTTFTSETTSKVVRTRILQEEQVLSDEVLGITVSQRIELKYADFDLVRDSSGLLSLHRKVGRVARAYFEAGPGEDFRTREIANVRHSMLSGRELDFVRDAKTGKLTVRSNAGDKVDDAKLSDILMPQGDWASLDPETEGKRSEWVVDSSMLRDLFMRPGGDWFFYSTPGGPESAYESRQESARWKSMTGKVTATLAPADKSEADVTTIVLTGQVMFEYEVRAVPGEDAPSVRECAESMIITGAIRWDKSSHRPRACTIEHTGELVIKQPMGSSSTTNAPPRRVEISLARSGSIQVAFEVE